MGIVVGSLPEAIARVLKASSLDGQPLSFGENGFEWVSDARNEERRRACLLNILGVLCVKPSPERPFIDDVLSVIFVRHERIYCKVRGSLLNRLRLLSIPPPETEPDAHRYVFAEGRPKAPIHGDLCAAAYLLENAVIQPDDLQSFRCDGNPSMQIVLPGVPAVETYADIDLDKFDPLSGLVDLIGHVVELQQGETDHVALYPAVKRIAGDFLAYTLSA